MAHTDYIKLEFPSRSVNESFARATVACFAARLDPTLEELSDIKTAVSEAVTNCIVHAYPGVIGTIWIRAKIVDETTIEIMVKDNGVGIPDIKRAREPMYTTGGDDRSGMGFTIMESFMDKVRVRSAEGKGTTVFMSRKIIRKTSEI
ncbi:MAG: anti-sigma F factor [Clostridiales bacterium]|nr:anti-sigma F factor [Clostridiales bacterium]